MQSYVEFPNLDSFERHVIAGEFVSYSAPIQFRGGDADLVIYPNRDGEIDEDRLRVQFVEFQQSLDTALEKLPDKLRRICAEYDFDVSDVPDEEMVQNITWVNVKLLDDGGIECYTRNDRVTYLDIVLGFTPRMQLKYVHFDG